MQNDPQVVLTAVQTNLSALSFVLPTSSLWSNPEFVVGAVKLSCELTLKGAPRATKKNHTIMLAMAEHCPNGLCFAVKFLWKDCVFVLELVRIGGASALKRRPSIIGSPQERS